MTVDLCTKQMEVPKGYVCKKKNLKGGIYIYICVCEDESSQI